MTAILRVDGLSKTFARRGLRVRAVHRVSFDVAAGETMGIVGESGCGKSTLARMLVGLEAPTSGHVRIADQDLKTLSREPIARGRLIQYVFQDSMGALNPRKRIQAILDAPLVHLMRLDDAERNERIAELLDAVGLQRDILGRYPHEVSGGQAQRIGIARALAASPRILVLDEPVSALDVSVQAQVLELLSSLREQFNLTYLFISHDLGVIEAISDRVAVMYFGSIVELGNAELMLGHPRHPYSALLATSAKNVVLDRRASSERDVELPDPTKPPPGCAFVDRCRQAQTSCHTQTPTLQALSPHSRVACFHPLADSVATHG